ncbi:MAG TPA: hypothetical protein PKD24_09985 [Pyrinomonadaceae bacterium]|nr:hypothetical protein [Pyrinomonadaceae bacterium]HMP65510.1 hypothetical protein [Pyrinomonadaceae bacterium]
MTFKARYFIASLFLFSAAMFGASSLNAGSPTDAAYYTTATDRFVGTYRREFTGPSGLSTEMLDLREDLSATFTGTYQNRGSISLVGSWTRARGRVIVSFPPVDEGGKATVMEFQRTGGFLFFTSGSDLKLSSVTPSDFAKTGSVYERIRRG